MSLSADDVVALYEGLGVARGSSVAVGVSGGPDSLSLLLLTAPNFDVTAITVDHGLRAESAKEAGFVAKLCADRGIRHVTLKWEGEKPTSNIQAEARTARYSLMQQWCIENSVAYLAAAHHQDDQAETLLLRLARGSGVYGLAAIPNVRDIGEGVSIVRPLLGVAKEELIQVLQQANQAWIDDPSNSSEAYDRIRVRKFLNNPPLEGLTSERLAATAVRLRRSRDALEYYEGQWLAKAVSVKDEGYIVLRRDQLETEPEEIILRGLASVCRFFNDSGYVPRMEKLQRLKSMLFNQNFRGHTLYGAQFSCVEPDKILVSRELSAVEGRKSLKESAIWDNRFAIRAKGAISGLKIGALESAGWTKVKSVMPDFEQIDMPRLAGLGLPAIYDGAELKAVPHLRYDTLAGLEIEVSLKTDILTKK